MIHPGETLVALAGIILPIVLLGYLFYRWFRLKERKLELQASEAAEKAALYAASNAGLEARIRVLEKIVTDGGYHTATQIEALRDRPALAQGDKIQ